MSSTWGSIEDFNGFGHRFIPKDHVNAVAIVWRPTRYERDVPGGYQGKTRDVVTWADFHIFASMDEVRDGKPSTVLLDAECDAASIARRGVAMVDSGTGVAVPFILAKERTHAGNTTWVPKAPSPDVSNKVREYWDRVMADEKAAADELSDLGI